MRIIYNNLADIATISVSPTPSLGNAANLQNNRKSSICRTSGTTVYTLTWTTPQQINAVALPATNLLHASIIEVNFYSTSGSATPFETINDQAAFLRSPLLPGNITQPDYRYFSLGGATKTSVYSESINTATQKTGKLTITLTNPGFTGGQIDCSRIVCGKYWEPIRQASTGITISTQDNSEISTTRSGDNYINTTYIKELMNFELKYINDTDRQRLLEIFRSWGTSSYVYVCVFPDNQNPELTQSYSIYGRNSDMSIQYDIYSFYTTNLSLESW